ncbi:cell division protein FtsL [Candidatus Avelusimicrobium aviculae]|uniref:cell division protein FtsL n=1 Tax=Candidatus Avelusimicrobium aviculae TaxID=3416206 RepID=UPI003D0C814F
MKIFAVLFLISVFAMGVVVMRMEINRSGREISKLQNHVEVQEARNQYVQLEIARLESPAHVSALAQEKLGMQFTKPHNVVVLED